MPKYHLSFVSECTQCGMLTSNLIWCDQLCMRWSKLITRKDFARGIYPSLESWKAFCLKYYDEEKPMYKY